MAGLMCGGELPKKNHKQYKPSASAESRARKRKELQQQRIDERVERQKKKSKNKNTVVEKKPKPEPPVPIAGLKPFPDMSLFDEETQLKLHRNTLEKNVTDLYIPWDIVGLMCGVLTPKAEILAVLNITEQSLDYRLLTDGVSKTWADYQNFFVAQTRVSLRKNLFSMMQYADSKNFLAIYEKFIDDSTEMMVPGIESALKPENLSPADLTIFKRLIGIMSGPAKGATDV